MHHIETKCQTVTMTENQITELRTVYSDCQNLHVYRKFVFNFLGHPSLNICFFSFHFSTICLVVENKSNFLKNKTKTKKIDPSYYDVKIIHTKYVYLYTGVWFKEKMIKLCQIWRDLVKTWSPLQSCGYNQYNYFVYI